MTDHFSAIRDVLFLAQNSCDAWWILEGRHSHRDTVIRAFAEHPMVFETLRPSLFTCFVIKLCSVFGTGSHDITLKSLPSAKSDPDFERIWSVGSRLYKYRSKIIAHLDDRMTPDEVASEVALTPDEVRELLAATVALFDRIAQASGEMEILPTNSEQFVDFLRKVSVELAE